MMGRRTWISAALGLVLALAPWVTPWERSTALAGTTRGLVYEFHDMLTDRGLEYDAVGDFDAAKVLMMARRPLRRDFNTVLDELEAVNDSIERLTELPRVLEPELTARLQALLDEFKMQVRADRAFLTQALELSGTVPVRSQRRVDMVDALLASDGDDIASRCKRLRHSLRLIRREGIRLAGGEDIGLHADVTWGGQFRGRYMVAVRPIGVPDALVIKADETWEFKAHPADRSISIVLPVGGVGRFSVSPGNAGVVVNAWVYFKDRTATQQYESNRLKDGQPEYLDAGVVVRVYLPAAGVLAGEVRARATEVHSQGFRIPVDAVVNILGRFAWRSFRIEGREE